MFNRPGFTGYAPDFRFGTNPSENNFTGGNDRTDIGVRMSGLFHPPQTGVYRFFIRGDDETRLFISPNGPSPSGKMRVAQARKQAP